MNWFSWKGITATGKTVKGAMQAHSLASVKKHLLDQGIALLEAHPTRLAISPFVGWHRILPPQQLLDFFNNLALLLISGIPLLGALDIILHQSPSKKSRLMLQDLKTSIKNGSSFAQALAQFPNTFNQFTLHLIAAGEKTGNLGSVLEHLKHYLNITITLRSQLKRALLMPLITLSFSLLLLWIILIFVIPHFNTLYQSLGCAVPSSTQIIIGLSTALSSWWGLGIIIMLIPIGFVAKQSIKLPILRHSLHSIVLQIPFLNSIILQREVLRLIELITLFLKTGLPLTQALEHAQSSSSTPVFQKHVHSLLNTIIEGKTLSQGLEEIGTPYFDMHLIALIKVGEHANSLTPMLEKATNLYKQRLSKSLYILSTIAAPLFMIVVGLFIGGLMVLMYLPILNMGSLFGT